MKMRNSPIPFLLVLITIFFLISLGEWKIANIREQPEVIKMEAGERLTVDTNPLEPFIP